MRKKKWEKSIDMVRCTHNPTGIETLNERGKENINRNYFSSIFFVSLIFNVHVSVIIAVCGFINFFFTIDGCQVRLIYRMKKCKNGYIFKNYHLAKVHLLFPRIFYFLFYFFCFTLSLIELNRTKDDLDKRGG